MRYLLSLLTCCLLSVSAYCQKKARWEVEIQYGANGNFFVRDYNETGGPANKTYFYKKNFLGSVSGLEAKYNFSPRASIALGYARSIHKGIVNFSGQVNGADIFITDFSIRHINDFYQLIYDRRIQRNTPSWRCHMGLVLASMHQQEILIENFTNQVLLQERNTKNSGLQEAGLLGGIGWSRQIDKRLSFGIKLRGYYFLSSANFEAVSITPILAFKL